jgi:flagellar basal-body rod protein FlgB
MLSRLFSTGSLPALEALLRFASERQRVIAGNIANVDTEGYRTRDLSESDFHRSMAEAYVARRESPVGAWAMRPAGRAPSPAPAADAGSLKPGGNNVDLEIEMAKMVKNSALHSTVATLLAQQFTLLREAIAGHVIS